MAFAVIALAIIIAGFAGIIGTVKDSAKKTTNQNALTILKEKCDLTCSSLEYDDANLALVDIASETILFTKEDRICYEFDEDTQCVLCACDVKDRYHLDPTPDPILDLTGTKKLFSSHRYRCELKKDAAVGITITCQG